MLQSKSLLEYTNLSSHDDYEKNDKIINYFQQLTRWKNFVMLIAVSIENLEKTWDIIHLRENTGSFYYLQYVQK